MALITISGYPSSGKSRRADQIKTLLEARLKDSSSSSPSPSLQVVCISDDTLDLDRSAYDDSRAEKPARASLFTAMQRHMSSNTILIVDGMNYIKGFRYQMYCAARELKLRVCTVHVVAPPESCKQWNEERQDGKAYKPETLENLIQRYEEPSSMVRWDSPLITVLWSDDVPFDQIWKAIIEGNVKPPNAGTQAVPKAPTSALHTLEQTTTSLLSQLISAQSTSPSPSSGGSITLSLPSSPSNSITVEMPPRTVTLAELQRMKRQFVTVHKKAITLGTVEKGSVDWGEESVMRKFGVYLEENLRG